MSETVVQSSFIPETPPVVRDELVDIDELPGNDDLVSSEPSKALIASIKTYGILEPLILAEHLGMLAMIDGRRRLKAARAAGLSEVPVRIIQPGTESLASSMPSILTINTHVTRKDNIAAEFLAIRGLLERDFNEQMICQITGILPQTLKKRMLLLRLPKALLHGFLAGQIAVSVAESAAKLPPELVAKLVALFEERGKLSAADVREVKQAAQKPDLSQMETMPGFDEMASDDDDYGKGILALQRAKIALEEGMATGDKAQFELALEQVMEALAALNG